MAATQLSRTTLDNLFSDGERPTGENFASAWLSFLHKGEDGLSYDGKNLVIASDKGITLGNPAGGPGGAPGTLRFNGTRVQYYDPGVNDFKDIAGGAGAFLPVGAGPAVSFGTGNVGIGNYPQPGPVPTHRLEVQLNANTDAGQEVLLGNLVIHNGPLATPGAYIGNNALATNAAGFALFQDSVGKTIINASNNLNSGLTLAINNVQRLFIGRDGNISLTPAASTAISGAVNIAGDVTIGSSLVERSLTVFGTAAKSGSLVWTLAASDERVKKDIRPYKDGLDKLIQFKPVVYKYNGKAGIADNGDNVGLIAQDVQKVAPEMVFSRKVKLNPDDEKDTDLLNYDFHNVLFMAINAFKELNARVEKLEKSKK